VFSNTLSLSNFDHGEHVWWFSGLYGPHRDAEKTAFLKELREVRSHCNGPWMLAGDPNMIYSSEDKNNDNLNRAMMGKFRHLVKLDRVLCTGGFLRYTIRPVRPVEKGLVCNRKGPICKDPTVEINSIRLVFLAVVR
jgi:hypothetical protein